MPEVDRYVEEYKAHLNLQQLNQEKTMLTIIAEINQVDSIAKTYWMLFKKSFFSRRWLPWLWTFNWSQISFQTQEPDTIVMLEKWESILKLI